MGGLVYKTSTWNDRLWGSHVEHSPPAEGLLIRGAERQEGFSSFAEDVHARLYLPYPPEEHEEVPSWASTILQEAEQLSEWKQLRYRCQHQGFAAGVATERLLATLVDLLPEQSDTEPDATESAQGAQGAAMRSALRVACRAAAQDVDGATSAVEGVAECLGLQAGTDPGNPETLHSLDEVRALYELLRNNDMLTKIAALSGRLSRLGDRAKRCTVLGAVGAINGITIGGDLTRILPAELVGIRSTSRIGRLSTLGKILGKRALQYTMRTTAPETRGPICIAIDESGSMEGEPLLWSKAIALALLSTATRQRRAWWLGGFTTFVRHEHLVEPGGADQELLTEILRHGASGGTAFDPPLERALQIIAESPHMRKADILLVTDGEAAVSQEVAQQVLEARQRHDVHLYVIGIGGDARLETLAPIASKVYRVSTSPTRDSETIAEIIALTP